MESARNVSLQVFTLTLVAALFLCQVFGAFCTMVPVAVAAAAFL